MLSSLNPPRSFPGARPQSGQDQSGQQGKVRQSGGQPGDSQEGQPGEEARDSQDSQGKGAGAERHRSRPASSLAAASAARMATRTSGRRSNSPPWARSARSSASARPISPARRRSKCSPPASSCARPTHGAAAQHSQGGAEIGRDEIPVALQTYVSGISSRCEVGVPGRYSQTRLGTPRSRSFTRSYK